MKKIILSVISILISTTSYAEPETVEVKSVDNRKFRVEVAEIYNALRLKFLNAGLRYKTLETIGKTTIVEQPEIKVSGSWIRLYPLGDSCRLFGFKAALEFAYNNAEPSESLAVVDSEGYFIYTLKAGESPEEFPGTRFGVTKITCKTQ